MRTDEDRVQPLTLKLKRSASGIQRLTTSTLTSPLHIKPSSTSAFPTSSAIIATAATSNNCSPSSVQAARKNVQSTAELVAQISEQLQHYGTIFDTTALTSNNNKETIRQQLQVNNIQNDVVSMPLLAENGVEFINKYESTTTKRRRVKLSDPSLNHSQDNELVNGRHQAEDAVNKKKENKKKRGRPKMTDTGIYLNNNISDGGFVMIEKSTTTTNNSQSLRETPKFNWFEKYPLPNMPTRNSDSSQIPSTIIENPCNSYALPLNNFSDEKSTEKRKILILPYLDIGEPDWLIHGFPERERYLFPDFDAISSFQSLKQNFKKSDRST